MSVTPHSLAFLSADDRELLTQRFQVDAPDTLDGVVETLPENWQSAAIEFDYELDRKKRVRCAHPGRHPHRIGVVLRTPDQRRFLVGWRCGMKHHGLDLKSLKRKWDAKKDRSSFLGILVRVAPHLSGAMSDVRALLDAAPCKNLDKLKYELRAFNDAGFQKLQLAVQMNGGMLTRFERVRDEAAERRRDEADEIRIADIRARTKGLPPARTSQAQARAEAEITEIQKRQRPLFKTVSVELGTMEGAAMVRSIPSPREELSQVQTDLRSAFNMLNSPSELPTKELRRLTKLIREAIDKAKVVRANLIDVQSFYRPANLRRVAAAMDAQIVGGELQTDERTLRLPDSLEVPPINGLLALEASLAG